jgi:hypothetical protein
MICCSAAYLVRGTPQWRSANIMRFADILVLAKRFQARQKHLAADPAQHDRYATSASLQTGEMN